MGRVDSTDLSDAALAMLDSVDWTRSSEGVSNSSQRFKHIGSEIEKIINFETKYVLNPDAVYRMSRFIVAQLAHKHRLSPPQSAVCPCQVESSYACPRT